MNTLSWLIYFADIVSNLQGLLTTIAVIMGTACVIAIGPIEIPIKRVRLWIVVAALVSVIAALLPSKNTVYAIAASELGEQVLVSNTGKKAVAALEAWLDAQVKGLK